MINFFTHKILFASTYPVGFGDVITNTVIIKYFTEKFGNRVLVHYYLNETICERNDWFFYHYMPCDKVFSHPFHWHDTHFNLSRFENMTDNYYDYVIIDHVTDKCLEEMKDKFKNAIFISLHDYICQKYKVESLVPYFNITNDTPEYRNRFRPYSINDQFNTFFSLIDNSPYVAIFPFSTRPLASVTTEGIKKVVEFAKRKMMKTVICGENYCPYSAMSFQNSLNEFVSSIKDDSVINLMGLGLHKVCRILEKAKYVFYGPTGSAMLGIYAMAKNPNSYLLSGGDTGIMHGIYNLCHPNFPQMMNIITTKCPHFPCGDIPKNTKIEKVMTCRTTGNAKCLNEELNIEI